MVKDYKDYIPELKKLYSNISEDSIEEIVKKGLSTIQDLIRRDHDIRLENLNCNYDQYRLIFYRSQNTDKRKKERYFKNLIRLKKYRDNKKKKHE